MDEQELGERVANECGQKFEGSVEGPVRFGLFMASRVWTHDGDEYHAHYAIQRRGYPLKIFRNFLPFAAWLDEEFDLDARAKRIEGRIKTLVAAVIVLGGFALLAYLVIRNPQTDFPIGYVVTAIIGGAAGFMFGNWSRAPAGTDQS